MTRKQSEMLKQPILGTDSKILVRGHRNVQEHSLPLSMAACSEVLWE